MLPKSFFTSDSISRESKLREYLVRLKAMQKLKAKLLVTLDNAIYLAQSKPHVWESCDDSRRFPASIG